MSDCEFKQNVKNGFGSLSQKISDSLYFEYTGFFEDDQFDGQGKYTAYESRQKKCMIE